MNSRFEKYYLDDTKTPSRQAKNKRLYSEINDEKFNLNSNISVIDDDGNNIDLSKLKNILDEKYTPNEVVNRRIDYIDDEEDVEYLDATRDYDINLILEKARENKVVNYEEDRLRKARNDQFDILNNLEITQTKINTDKPLSLEITTLIEKINGNEKQSSSDDFGLLGDLVGGEDTTVMPAINDNLDADFDVVEENKARQREIEKNISKTDDLGKSLLFNTDDFKEFKDLGNDDRVSPFTIIISVIIIGLLLFGITYMLNILFEWNLFS